MRPCGGQVVGQYGNRIDKIGEESLPPRATSSGGDRNAYAQFGNSDRGDCGVVDIVDEAVEVERPSLCSDEDAGIEQ